MLAGTATAQQVVKTGSDLSLTGGVLNATPLSSRVTGIESQVATNQANIAVLQGQVTGGGVIKTINGTSYTITAADNGNTLLFKTKCTVTFSGLTTGFKCSCHQEGGNIIFSGTNPLLNKFGYTRSQTVGAWVEVILLPLGISLKGDLTK